MCCREKKATLQQNLMLTLTDNVKIKPIRSGVLAFTLLQRLNNLLAFTLHQQRAVAPFRACCRSFYGLLSLLSWLSYAPSMAFLRSFYDVLTLHK